MPRAQRIIIASRNRGKVREIRNILALKDVLLQDLLDIGFRESIEEEGESFEENALIKAETVHRWCRVPVISDDSGLVVPYLKGEPGVRSARYAGTGADDGKNNQLLLEKLRNARGEERRAWFSCVALFYYDDGVYRTAEGRVEGIITDRPRGNNGFGYDPLFFVPHLGKTMAQLTDDEKNSISHRGAAFRGIKKYIDHYLARVEE